jgi:hypothetical protein
LKNGHRAAPIALLGMAMALASARAAAEPMPARETARVLPKAGVSTGILSPFAMGLGGGWEANAMLVPWLMLSPNLSLRVELGRIGKNVVVTGEYGMSLPTGAMRLTTGYLFPTSQTSGKRPGWVATPSAGLWISGGERNVWTGRLETTVGIPLGDDLPTPLETYAPLELAFAPALTGFRTRAGVAYDFAIVDWLRARAAVNGYIIGKSPFPPKSPLFVSAELGLEIGLGKTVRVALGGIWYNYDQRDKVLEKGEDGRWRRTPVRSNDFFPTFDLILRTR